MKPTRTDQEFINKYKKNQIYEEVISNINRCLSDVEHKFLDEDIKEVHPNLYVLGVPRSGTTLINQFLSMAFDIGYINNLIAAFWNCPIQGIYFSKKLLGTTYKSDFQSSYGSTENIKEPHEFGYFWSKMLSINELKEPTKDHFEKVDWDNYRKTILSMNQAFDKGIIFKAIHLGWFVEEVINILPKSIFIYVSRDWKQNAASLLKIREKYLGDKDKWASFKPKEYEWLKSMGNIDQVVGQVYFLNKVFKEKLDSIPSKNKIYITYEEFCENPDLLVDEVINKVQSLGMKLSKDNIKTPSQFEYSSGNIKNNISEKMINSYERFNN